MLHRNRHITQNSSQPRIRGDTPTDAGRISHPVIYLISNQHVVTPSSRKRSSLSQLRVLHLQKRFLSTPSTAPPANVPYCQRTGAPRRCGRWEMGPPHASARVMAPSATWARPREARKSPVKKTQVFVWFVWLVKRMSHQFPPHQTNHVLNRAKIFF